jgi:hypothetical protein
MYIQLKNMGVFINTMQPWKITGKLDDNIHLQLYAEALEAYIKQKPGLTEGKLKNIMWWVGATKFEFLLLDPPIFWSGCNKDSIHWKWRKKCPKEKLCEAWQQEAKGETGTMEESAKEQ